MTTEDAIPDWFSAQLREKLGEEEANRTLEFFRRARLRQKAMREVSSDSDRCVGIVAPVFVEEELKICLQRHFVVPGNSKLKDKLSMLFQQSQPLGSFSTLIDMGYLFFWHLWRRRLGRSRSHKKNPQYLRSQCTCQQLRRSRNS